MITIAFYVRIILGDSMELEKEVRYKINDEQKEKILLLAAESKKKEQMLDITCGFEGFDSLSKLGYICRVRQKGNKKTLEVKNYSNENECVEETIELDKLSTGVNYLKLIGMKPYLYLCRTREIRKFNDLKVVIDELDLLGDYVEIEYQDSKDSENELQEFRKLIGIINEPADKYGDIVKKLLETDNSFQEKFNDNLEKILVKY